MQKEQQAFEDFVKSQPIRSSALPVSPKEQLLPLNSLDWQSFELLCCQLVKLEPDTVHAYIYGVPGDNQEGIDIVAKKRVDGGYQTWCYQCKDYKKFTQALLKKAIKALKFPADHYVICIAHKATAGLRKIASDNNIDLWDAQEISFKLKNQPKLVADFFHPAWVDVFCVTQEISQIKIPEIYTPPQPNALFIGREDELKSLHEQLGKQRVIIIEGIGGMGKTQLVLQALQTLNDMPTIWLDVESCRDVLDLKNTLLRVFLKENTDDKLEESLLELLSTLPPLRIIIDGLDRIATSQWDQASDFLSYLVRLTRTHQLLITTQIQMNDLDFEAFRLTLQPLSLADSAQILTSASEEIAIKVGDTSSLDWLLHFCDGHPLSLRLVLGLLRYYRNIEAVAKRLRANQAQALEDPHRNQQKTSTSLAVCLEVAYSHFSHQQQRLLQFVSCFPVGCIDIFSQEWQKSEDYETNVAELMRFFFIEMRQDPMRECQRLYLLNPIRHFVRSKWKMDAPSEAMDIQLAAAQTIEFHAGVVAFTNLNMKISTIGLETVDFELPNCLAAMEYATEVEKLRKAEHRDFKECLIIKVYLAYHLMSYFFVRIFLPYNLHFIQAGIDAGEQLGDGYLSEVMDLYNLLFSLEKRLNLYKERGVIETKLTSISAQTANDLVKALASRNLGDLKMDNRQYDEAIGFYNIAEQYFRNKLQGTSSYAEREDKEVDFPYFQGTLAIILAGKGRAYEYQRAYQNAIVHYSESIDLLKKIKDNFNIGSIYFHLGNCYGYLGKTKSAFEQYMTAINYFVYISNGQFLSNALCEIGELLDRTDFDLTSLKTAFSEEMIALGLADASKEIVHLLHRWKTNAPFRKESFPIDFVLLRKILAITKLLSVTEHLELLETFASNIEKGWVSPLLDTLLAKWRNTEEQSSAYSVLWKALQFIHDIQSVLMIAQSIPSMLREEKVPNERASEIYAYCEMFHYPLEAKEWFWRMIEYYGINCDIEDWPPF